MLIFGGRRANIDHIFLKRKPKVHQCDLEFLASWAVDCKYCQAFIQFLQVQLKCVNAKHYYLKALLHLLPDGLRYSSAN